ncbi:MAG TPA: hypothetical protein VEC36_08935 [Patescibacteria group bacterium]|nr:hypothetical protein [Patescibacteria group bacterium]
MKIFIFLTFFSLLGITSYSTFPESNPYFPLSEGSTWVYEEIKNNDTTLALAFVYICGDSIVNNNRYKMLCNQSLKNPKNQKALLRVSHDTVFGFTGENDEIILIAKRGAIWADTLRGYHQYITIVSKVIDDNLRYELDNQMYDSVLHIQNLTTSHEFYTDDSTVTQEDFYFGKNIGLLEVKANRNRVKLKQFDIK